MEMTFRWFGTGFDTVSLKQIRQIPGVTGVITTLYDTTPGEVWSRERIRALKDEVESAGLYVISNKCMHLGASAILDDDVISEVARRCKTDKFIVCPSSKHEMLLFPDNGTMDFEEVCDLVKHINNTEVDEKDRLTDRAYKLTV